MVAAHAGVRPSAREELPVDGTLDEPDRGLDLQEEGGGQR
jgi:hypothetical protein